MKFFSLILSVVKNKYLVALIVFGCIMIFFDENNIFVQQDRKEQLSTLSAKKNFYENEITKTRRQLADLQNNPSAIEKYARENFYMKKPNEDLFILPGIKDSTK